MSKTYYIYSEEDQDFVDKNKTLEVWNNDVIDLPFSKLDEMDKTDVSHLVVTGSHHEIKSIIEIAYTLDVSIGIIPRIKQKALKSTLELPSKINDIITLALTPSTQKLDLLYCNGITVLEEVVIGDAPPLDQYDTEFKEKTFIDRIKLLWKTLKTLKNLKHTRVKILDAKENEFRLSAVGLVGVEYNNATFASKLVKSQLNSQDGKFSMVVLSPTSIMQYFSYLFKSYIYGLQSNILPRSVGYISSSKMTIETEKPLDIRIDSANIGKTPALLTVKEKVLALSVGKGFLEKQVKTVSPKDSIKVAHLPSDEESSEYLSKSIPLFTHASQAQYASLFTSLREESKITSVFMILLIFSTMIATFGLFINSGSVIIGAMLLAPLMQPIVSLSMGVLRQDSNLEFNAAKTIFFGVTAVLFTAASVALFTPIETLTSEMSGRLSPTILDLFVAIVSGAAAAYAKSNEKIIGSLAGVAIAVALVPPLAVSGIGLGWGNWHMFSMALLLFITNLVGIVLAAAFTFVMLGFSPLKIAKKGIMIWLIMAIIVSMPLYSSFLKMENDMKIKRILTNTEFVLHTHKVKLSHINIIHQAKEDELRCEVIARSFLSKEEKILLKEKIQKSIAKKVDVIVTFRYRL